VNTRTLAAARSVRLVQAESRNYLRRLRAARARPQRAPVHALRVATRRLQALLDLLRPIGADAQDREFERSLRRIFKDCGHLRDLQVMRRNVAAATDRYPETAAFLVYLDQRLAKARGRLQHRLKAAHPRRLRRHLDALAVALAGTLAQPSVRARAGARLAQRLQHTRRGMRAARRRIGATDARALHRTRIALKACRYEAELLGSLGIGARATEVRQLQRRQDALGAITDRDRLLEQLRSFARRHPKAGRALAGFGADVRQERRTLARRYPARTAARSAR
jgi:CHAD domain-containing protein